MLAETGTYTNTGQEADMLSEDKRFILSNLGRLTDENITCFADYLAEITAVPYDSERV